jgi:hypothetical protein
MAIRLMMSIMVSLLLPFSIELQTPAVRRDIAQPRFGVRNSHGWHARTQANRVLAR